MSPEYKEIIEKNNITVIQELAQITELFDPKTIGLIDQMPTISVEVPTMIMFDTPIYNSAYLLDEFLKFKNTVKDIESFTDYIQKIFNHNISSTDEINARLNNDIKVLYQRFEDLKISDVKFYYCDNESIIDTLFKPYFEANKNQLGDITTIRPALLSINTLCKDIYIDVETFKPLNIETFFNSYYGLTIKPEEFVGIKDLSVKAEGPHDPNIGNVATSFEEAGEKPDIISSN